MAGLMYQSGIEGMDTEIPAYGADRQPGGNGNGAAMHAGVSRLTEEQVQIWRKRIQRALRQKKDMGITAKWAVLEQFYRGQYFKKMSKDHQVATNWMFALIRQAMASIYFQNPTFYMRGLTVAGRQSAPIMEQVYIAERKVMGAKRPERRALQHGLQLGLGTLKHGYSSSLGIEQPYRQIAPGAPPINTWTPGMEGETYSDTSLNMDDFKMPRGAFVELWGERHYGHPWKRAIKPQDILIDPEAVEISEARWICHRYDRPYVDVKEDVRLDPEVRAKLKPSGMSGFSVELDEDYRKQYPSVYDDAAMVRLYEIFDCSRRRVILLTDTVDMPLLDKRYEHFGDLGPYAFLQFFEHDEHPYGIAWAETFKPQVEVLNSLRSQMLQHLETWGQLRGGFLKGKADGNDIKQLLNNTQANVLVGIEGTEKVEDALTIFPRIEIAPDAWRLSDQWQTDLVDISGATELRQQKKTPTATEASYFEEKSALRIDDMRGMFEDFLLQSALRDLKSLKAFWGPDRVVPIVGEDGIVWMMARVSQDVVLSDYEILIEAGSTQRVDKAVRTRQVIDTMDRALQWMPVLQQHGFIVNSAELFKNFLKQTDVFRQPERVLIAMPGNEMAKFLGNQQMLPQGTQAPMGMGMQPGMGGIAGGGMGAPTAVTQMGTMPWEQNAGVAGRVMSEAFGGGR